jgi:hypothetical protein
MWNWTPALRMIDFINYFEDATQHPLGWMVIITLVAPFVLFAAKRIEYAMDAPIVLTIMAWKNCETKVMEVVVIREGVWNDIDTTTLEAFDLQLAKIMAEVRKRHTDRKVNFRLATNANRVRTRLYNNRNPPAHRNLYAA